MARPPPTGPDRGTRRRGPGPRRCRRGAGVTGRTLLRCFRARSRWSRSPRSACCGDVPA